MLGKSTVPRLRNPLVVTGFGRWMLKQSKYRIPWKVVQQWTLTSTFAMRRVWRATVRGPNPNSGDSIMRGGVAFAKL